MGAAIKIHLLASLTALALAALVPYLYVTRFRDPGPPPQPQKIECANLNMNGTIVRACQPIPPSYDRCLPGQILVGDIPVTCIPIADYCAKTPMFMDEVERLRWPRVCAAASLKAQPKARKVTTKKRVAESMEAKQPYAFIRLFYPPCHVCFIPPEKPPKPHGERI